MLLWLDLLAKVPGVRSGDLSNPKRFHSPEFPMHLSWKKLNSEHAVWEEVIGINEL